MKETLGTDITYDLATEIGGLYHPSFIKQLKWSANQRGTKGSKSWTISNENQKHLPRIKANSPGGEGWVERSSPEESVTK